MGSRVGGCQVVRKAPNAGVITGEAVPAPDPGYAVRVISDIFAIIGAWH